ncbi:DUF914-domain-containing protein [Fragilariopsis cylindrus CCMP1102]|uniref:DUF914-domain-containing protein n=1 Tax=Fragilariopsis cylindrus CCMP1102 TaxID=635003 RepID=A0A1E7FFT1_9STRA|nr:DUF914-domain-containing protein [Fragilariopsis cylindrus CCMP1102]|eukprot:OEU16905.1 DUF914-domain-containing protein [Fragilariopsis cylindrus CCMP1102]
MSSGGNNGICYRLRSNWKVLVLGQILSLLLACAGAAQATLYLNCGLSAPTFTMSLVYLGLTLTHLPILFWRRYFGEKQQQRRGGGGQERIPTHDIDNDGVIADDEDNNNEEAEHNDDDGTNIDNNVNNLPFLNRSFLWYLLLAFFDVEANAITMLAFRYTTLTSVTLFDALAIPASMIISKCSFQCRRYRTLHYFGVAICMMGIVFNVLQDYESDTTSKQQYFPHKIKGDICAIIGGLLYGLNDVLTEVTVTSGDTTEYLGMIGLFGFCISFVQSLVLEQDDIRKFFGNKENDDKDDTDIDMCSLPIGFILLFSFVGVTMLGYIGASRFLIISEAAFFNLSLLTGDLWSVVFSVVAERIVPQPLFFAALASVLSGVVLYEMAPSPAPEKEIKYEEDKNYTDNDGIIMLSQLENNNSTSN